MKIHEYQAKELLASAGAPVPRGVVVSSAAEAERAFDELGGGPVVVKAQVHAGGRGKGRFKGSGKDFGGVKFVVKRDDVAAVADVMLNFPLVTVQSGEAGQQVHKLLVVEAGAKIAREVYVGMVLDRAAGMPVLMACAEGGVEIEEVAAKTPEKILKTPVDPAAGLQPHQARRMAFELGFTGESRFLHRGHADDVDTPRAIEIRFGAGRELRAFDTQIDAAVVDSRARRPTRLDQVTAEIGADRIGERDMADDPVAEEGRAPLVGVIDELIDRDQIARRDMFLHAAGGADRNQAIDAKLLHPVDIRPIV